MDVEIIGVMIPVIAIVFGCSIGLLGVWTKHQQKMAEMQVNTTAEHTAEKAAQYASHIQKLEDRVQVLERIVTDRGYDIATQIEALRDTREVDARPDQQGAGIPLDMGSKEKV